MKVRLLIIFFLFTSNFMTAQVMDTIHGRIISSVTKKVPHGAIYILEKGTSNGTIADSTGVFKLLPINNNDEYYLNISVGAYKTLTYDYKSEWTKRSKPKSIVISADCSIFEDLIGSGENRGLKLYIIGGIAPVASTKSDKRFEKNTT